ncbi:TolC family protein [Roseivirga sp. BDSF3-8]|uniref:TolC family protein n=1 Tax=Roseivirga sp. BDSF3-8 TaxID=3241598 RepID=UPI003531E2C0
MKTGTEMIRLSLSLLLAPLLLCLPARAQDSTLAENWYVQVALDNNPELVAREKTWLAMKEVVDQAGQLEDPQLTAGVFISPIETRVGPQQARLGLRQMFPWFGSLSVREQLAVVTARAAYYDYLESRAATALEAHRRYAAIYRLRQDTALLHEQEALVTSLERIALTRYENAKGSLADVLKVQLAASELETVIKRKEQDLETAVATFNLTLYRDPEAAVTTPDSLLAELPAAAVAREAVATQYRLEGSRQSVEAARQREEVVRLQSRPMLGAGIDYVITGKREDMTMPDNGQDAIMPMVSVSLPIFRKKYKAQQSQAALDREAAEARLQAMENMLTADYLEAVSDYRNASTDAELYKKQTYLADKTLNLLISTYGAGDESLTNVLDVQQQILRYQMGLNESLTRQFVNAKKIVYLTGSDRSVITEENESTEE